MVHSGPPEGALRRMTVLNDFFWLYWIIRELQNLSINDARQIPPGDDAKRSMRWLQKRTSTHRLTDIYMTPNSVFMNLVAALIWLCLKRWRLANDKRSADSLPTTDSVAVANCYRVDTEDRKPKNGMTNSIGERDSKGRFLLRLSGGHDEQTGCSCFSLV